MHGVGQRSYLVVLAFGAFDTGASIEPKPSSLRDLEPQKILITIASRYFH